MGNLPKTGSGKQLYQFGGTLDKKLPRIDDSPSTEVNLDVKFPFYGEMEKVLYVNNNGLISFGTAISTYTPEAFPLAGERRFIAPYWADVDTRPLDGGTVWYREERDSNMLVIAKEDVEWAFPGTGFQPKWLFIATWENVGYYNQKTNKVNTFQCVLATDEKASFAIFLYPKVEWTTGDYSGGKNGLGGTPAQAGINAGDGNRCTSVFEALTDEIINIDKSSNVKQDGVYVYRVDGTNVTSPNPCAIKVNESTWKYDHGYNQEADIELSIGTVKVRHATPPREIYAMNGHKRHGVALIINNTFEHSPDHHRVGTDTDRDNLTTTFKFLGYEVIEWRNCDDQKMKAITSVFEESNDKQYPTSVLMTEPNSVHDSFVCCILSHGAEGKIKSNDNRHHVSLKEIAEPLVNYQPLKGKPKMFFIQACRGSERRMIVKKDPLKTDDRYVDHSGHEAKELEIPKFGADFFFGYATLPGFVAHRSDDGSPYIKLLCRTLCERGRHTNLVTMHTMLNHDAARNIIQGQKEEQYIQISEFEDSLRNFVYFFKQPRK